MPKQKVVRVYLTGTLVSALQDISDKWNLSESEVLRHAFIDFLISMGQNPRAL